MATIKLKFYSFLVISEYLINFLEFKKKNLKLTCIFTDTNKRYS